MLRKFRRNANNQIALPQSQVAAPPIPPPSPPLTFPWEDILTSLKICRVEKAGYLTAVPDDKVGHFYTGDSYCIFCPYMSPNQHQGIIIFIWHGSMSPIKTEDDVVHRAIQASFEDGGPPFTIQMRMIQGHEPAYFRSTFYNQCSASNKPWRKYIITHNGGAYCGDYGCVNHVLKEGKFDFNKSVFHIQSADDDVTTAYATAVVKSSTSINNKDCFVYVSDGLSFLWMGQHSSEPKRNIAFEVAGSLAMEPLAVVKMYENDNELDDFWMALGGKEGYTGEKLSSKTDDNTKDTSTLYLADGWNWKKLGSAYSKSDLDSNAVAVLDAGPEKTFVWVGSLVPKSTGMFYKATECLDSFDVEDSETRTVTVVYDHHEPSMFTSLFNDWEHEENKDAPANVKLTPKVVEGDEEEKKEDLNSAHTDTGLSQDNIVAKESEVATPSHQVAVKGSDMVINKDNNEKEEDHTAEVSVEPSQNDLNDGDDRTDDTAEAITIEEAEGEPTQVNKEVLEIAPPSEEYKKIVEAPEGDKVEEETAPTELTGDDDTYTSEVISIEDAVHVSLEAISPPKDEKSINTPEESRVEESTQIASPTSIIQDEDKNEMSTIDDDIKEEAVGNSDFNDVNIGEENSDRPTPAEDVVCEAISQSSEDEKSIDDLQESKVEEEIAPTSTPTTMFDESKQEFSELKDNAVYEEEMEKELEVTLPSQETEAKGSDIEMNKDDGEKEKDCTTETSLEILVNDLNDGDGTDITAKANTTKEAESESPQVFKEIEEAVSPAEDEKNIEATKESNVDEDKIDEKEFEAVLSVEDKINMSITNDNIKDEAVGNSDATHADVNEENAGESTPTEEVVSEAVSSSEEEKKSFDGIEENNNEEENAPTPTPTTTTTPDENEKEVPNAEAFDSTIEEEEKTKNTSDTGEENILPSKDELKETNDIHDADESVEERVNEEELMNNEDVDNEVIDINTSAPTPTTDDRGALDDTEIQHNTEEEEEEKDGLNCAHDPTNEPSTDTKALQDTIEGSEVVPPSQDAEAKGKEMNTDDKKEEDCTTEVLVEPSHDRLTIDNGADDTVEVITAEETEDEPTPSEEAVETVSPPRKEDEKNINAQEESQVDKDVATPTTIPDEDKKVESEAEVSDSTIKEEENADKSTPAEEVSTIVSPSEENEKSIDDLEINRFEEEISPVSTPTTMSYEDRKKESDTETSEGEDEQLDSTNGNDIEVPVQEMADLSLDVKDDEESEINTPEHETKNVIAKDESHANRGDIIDEKIKTTDSNLVSTEDDNIADGTDNEHSSSTKSKNDIAQKDLINQKDGRNEDGLEVILLSSEKKTTTPSVESIKDAKKDIQSVSNEKSIKAADDEEKEDSESTSDEKPEEVPEDIENKPKVYYTIEELKKPIDGVHWAKRQDFLTDEDFKIHLGISRNEFEYLPLWRQQNAKKKAGIY